MGNEFKVKHGIIVEDKGAVITGSISTNQDISASGSVTASYFSGNGSHLTDLSLSKTIRTLIPILSQYGTIYNWDAMPSASSTSSAIPQIACDLTNIASASLAADVTTPGASNSLLYVQYRPYGSNAWSYLGFNNYTPTVAISSSGTLMGSNILLNSVAREMVVLRVVGAGGDGVQTPQLSSVTLHVTYDL